MLLANRPNGALFALVSDHGMQGANKRVAVNQVLQQGVLLSVDAQGRVDLSKTKVLYPAVNNGYLLINSTDRKSGIVGQEERAELVRKISELLFSIRDGERQIVTAVFDAERDGEAKGIGGEVGGQLYIELAPGYDFDPRIGPGLVISDAEPYGTHGANPEQASMRTLMVFNGPGIRAGQKLSQRAHYRLRPDPRLAIRLAATQRRHRQSALRSFYRKRALTSSARFHSFIAAIFRG